MIQSEALTISIRHSIVWNEMYWESENVCEHIVNGWKPKDFIDLILGLKLKNI